MDRYFETNLRIDCAENEIPDRVLGAGYIAVLAGCIATDSLEAPAGSRRCSKSELLLYPYHSLFSVSNDQSDINQ